MKCKWMVMGLVAVTAMAASIGAAAGQTPGASGAMGRWNPETGARLDNLRLSEALRLSAENWLQGAEFEAEAAWRRQRENEAWRRVWLPSLTLEGSRTSGDLRTGENEREVQARLEYLLYAGGRHLAGYRAALSALAAGNLGAGQARDALGLQVADAFLALLSTGRRIETLRLSVEQARREFANMKRRRDLGLRTGLEVMQAQLALADEQFNLRAEVRTRTENALLLSHLIRRPVAPRARLAPDVAGEDSPRPLAHYQQAALANHKELARLKRDLVRARQEARGEEAADYPELLLTTGVIDPEGDERSQNVALSLVYRFGGHRTHLDLDRTKGTFGERFSTGDPNNPLEFENFEERERRTTSAGVTFFDFRDSTADQSSRQFQARFEQQRAARTLIEAREARLREVQRRFHALETARARLELERMRVRKDTAERDAYRRSYEGGSQPYEAVVERQTNLNRSLLAEIDARGEVLSAWIGLLHESGLPLSAPGNQG